MMEPESWTGKESAEIAYVKNFKKSCILIAQHTSLNIETLSTIDYLQSCEMLKKQFKDQQKAAIKGKK